ncbi:MAG: hypothetical protein ACRYF5_04480, partial [Janthinobacterium lividum]
GSMTATEDTVRRLLKIFWIECAVSHRILLRALIVEVPAVRGSRRTGVCQSFVDGTETAPLGLDP